jgi:copper(I)-binding protein
MTRRAPAASWCVGAFGVLLLAPAPAAHAIFSVTEPWVRAEANGRTAEVFMKVRSSDAATLIRVDSFAARTATIRSGTAKAATASLDLPAGSIVELKPNASHIRLSGRVRRLKLGEYVPKTLFVRSHDGREQKHFINAEVRHRSPTDDEAVAHGHAGHRH